MSSRTEDPELQWYGKMIYVSLPDKLRRIIEASRNPRVTRSETPRILQRSSESKRFGWRDPKSVSSSVFRPRAARDGTTRGPCWPEALRPHPALLGVVA